MPQEVYFLASEKYRPVLFGLPLLLSCNENTTCQDLYKSVWTQVSRLVSPLPPKEASANHATDCDDSLGYEYPFALKVVQRGGSWCAWCPWHRFCRGCTLPCKTSPFSFGASYIAIDWEQTALHLRYLAVQEKAFVEDPSVESSLKAATEPITLKKCLEAFTRQEELGENEKYYCSSCKTHQLASKKLQIWRLPPILIVHLKRFHFLNGRWIKSHKIVDFPLKALNPTDYLAAVPATTIRRHKELLALGAKARSALSSNMAFKNVNGIIRETSEGSSSNSSGILENGVHNHVEDDLDIIDEVDSINDDNNSIEEDNQDNEDVFELSMNRRMEELKELRRQNNMKAQLRSGSEADVERRRSRQESTSLLTHPIKDDNLQDFHEHRLQDGRDALDINYNMYAMVVRR